MWEDVEINLGDDHDYKEIDLIDIEINSPLSEEDIRLGELENLLFQEKHLTKIALEFHG